MSESPGEKHLRVPKELSDLVSRYDANRDAFRKSTFNETQTRIELIDPLFKLIGWDIANSKGYSDEYKEVIHEDRVRVEGKSKAPDYAFRIGGIRKFQLEAKSPSDKSCFSPQPSDEDHDGCGVEEGLS